MHRRTSSVVAAMAGREPPPPQASSYNREKDSRTYQKNATASSAYAPSIPPIADDPLPLPTTTTSSSHTMTSFRRRLRPLALLLFVCVLLLVGTLRTFLANGHGAGRRGTTLLPIPNANRDYHRNDVSDAAAFQKSIPKVPAEAAAAPPPSIPELNHSDAVDEQDSGSIPYPPSSRPGNKIQLTPEEELGCVVAYLISLGANARIPLTIDPSQPIDPELIVGFNTYSSRAQAEVTELISETWSINPIIVFGESREPNTKALKRLLDSYSLAPEPLWVDLADRSDHDVLAALLHRLTGVKSFPILIVAGTPVGPWEKVLSMGETGDLQRLLRNAGARLFAGRGRKGSRRWD